MTRMMTSLMMMISITTTTQSRQLRRLPLSHRKLSLRKSRSKKRRQSLRSWWRTRNCRSTWTSHSAIMKMTTKTWRRRSEWVNLLNGSQSLTHASRLFVSTAVSLSQEKRLWNRTRNSTPRKSQLMTVKYVGILSTIARRSKSISSCVTTFHRASVEPAESRRQEKQLLARKC